MAIVAWPKTTHSATDRVPITGQGTGNPVAGRWPVMASAAGTGLSASYLNIYRPAELVLLALAGLVIAAAGAMLPASWAAGTHTASALRAE